MQRCLAPSLLLLVGLCFSAANADEDPAFTAWYYPGAAQNSAATLGGKLHQALLITKDDVKKVENFYLKKSDDPLADVLAKDTEPPPFGIHSSQGYPHPKDPKSTSAPSGATIRGPRPTANNAASQSAPSRMTLTTCSSPPPSAARRRTRRPTLC